MKKLTLLAAIAACGLGVANAQYTTTEVSVTNTTGDTYWVFQLDETATANLEAAGKTVYNYASTGESGDRPFYVWDGTFIGGTPDYIGVEENSEYTSLEVSTVGWSGAGFAIVTPIDLTGVTDDTHFHFCVRSSNPPASIGVALANGSTWDDPDLAATEAENGPNANDGQCAYLSLGTQAFDGSYALIGDLDREGGEWVAIDMTFADIKKVFPTFGFVPGWFKGNFYEILAGGVQGTTIDIDGVYLYKTGTTTGVSEIAAADDVDVIVSGKTIQVLGNGNAGIELYNISGQLVKSANTAVVGCEGLSDGVYIVKAGNVVKKVVL